MDIKRDFWLTKKGDCYKYIENELLCIWISGVIFFDLDDGTTCSDLLSIASDILNENYDFNRLHGFYKIIIKSKKDDRYVFFGDNSGSQHLFIDIEKGLFSDSFLALVDKRKGKLNPCYCAIIQLLNDTVFTNETIVQGIYRTGIEKYYIYQQKEIFEKSKKLTSLSDREGRNLKDIMQALSDHVGEKHIGAVCTGGTDSRTVLACLNYFNKTPKLIITGHSENPDIKIASEVAQVLSLPLTIINPKEKHDSWLEKALLFSDGEFDTVLAFRHLQVLNWARENDIRYIFGGVGGEFYKNAFCSPVRYGAYKKPFSIDKICDLLIRERINVPSWASEALISAKNEVKQSIRNETGSWEESGTVLNGFNRVGYQILTTKSGLITNVFSDECTRIDPLMDRDLVATVSKKLPLTLAMHVWQRKQILSFCPKLCDIPTDAGYSCTMRPLKLTVERIKKGFFWTGRILSRLASKIGVKPKLQIGYWENDYNEARGTEEFQRCIEICKEKNIIGKNVEANIRNDHIGIIILLGQVFSRKEDL